MEFLESTHNKISQKLIDNGEAWVFTHETAQSSMLLNHLAQNEGLDVEIEEINPGLLRATVI